jgi:hypothetical protein
MNILFRHALLFLLIGGTSSSAFAQSRTTFPNASGPKANVNCSAKAYPAGTHDSFGAYSKTYSASFCVPPGKIFVIDYLTVWMTINSPSVLETHAELGFIHGGAASYHEFVLRQKAAPSNVNASFYFDGPVSIGVDANSSVSLSVDGFVNATPNLFFNVSGHYE